MQCTPPTQRAKVWFVLFLLLLTIDLQSHEPKNITFAHFFSCAIQGWKYHLKTDLFEMISSLGYIFTLHNRRSFQVRLGTNVGKIIFMRYKANENDFMPTYSKC